jgi:flagellar hook-basal body complex protein FliE
MDSVLVERLREVTPRLDEPVGLEPARGREAPSGRFGEIVADLVSDVNEKQNAASANAVGLARGEVGIMETVVSLNDADLSLRMMMQLRDRALDAYQRILRTI